MKGGAGRVRQKKAVERPDERLLTFYCRGPMLRDINVGSVTACTRAWRAMCASAHSDARLSLKRLYSGARLMKRRWPSAVASHRRSPISGAIAA